jgi:hypothetical protein
VGFELELEGQRAFLKEKFGCILVKEMNLSKDLVAGNQKV